MSHVCVSLVQAFADETLHEFRQTPAGASHICLPSQGLLWVKNTSSLPENLITPTANKYVIIIYFKIYKKCPKMYLRESESVCVCVRERVRVCVCVCERE